MGKTQCLGHQVLVPLVHHLQRVLLLPALIDNPPQYQLEKLLLHTLVDPILIMDPISMVDPTPMVDPPRSATFYA